MAFRLNQVQRPYMIAVTPKHTHTAHRKISPDNEDVLAYIYIYIYISQNLRSKGRGDHNLVVGISNEVK